MKKPGIVLATSLLLFITPALLAQVTASEKYTIADTLRGSYGPGRSWWDALKYKIDVKFNLADSTISGSNEIEFKVLTQGKEMQIDLQEPLVIDSIIYPGKSIRQASYKKIGNAYFIPSEKYATASINRIRIYYHGKPRTAVRPPWDGGVSWRKDINSNPWISISCQQLGASVWYPCKDHQSDEPDHASLSITAPTVLVSISNGRLQSKKDNMDNTSTSTWSVVNPINNYCIIPY
ncbi:MAG: M1 family peptidase, partial [Chitinophagaceae bacterium]